MSYENVEFPAIKSNQITNAKLFANRLEMIQGLSIQSNPRVVEVGVALGYLSAFILEKLHCSEFVAIDTFEMHLFPVHWGRTSKELFGSLTHLETYENRFNSFKELRVYKDFSDVGLSKLEDEKYDLIYLDAAHDYKHVTQDAIVAAKKIKKNGILVFNDYIMWDPFIDAEYGVVQVVNKMLDSGGWEVVGFAFERNLFCDIAIKQLN